MDKVTCRFCHKAWNASAVKVPLDTLHRWAIQFNSGDVYSAHQCPECGGTCFFAGSELAALKKQLQAADALRKAVGCAFDPKAMPPWDNLASCARAYDAAGAEGWQQVSPKQD